MKYWFDTEFIEQPFSLQLVSIGMVAQDGRELYVENSEVDWGKATDWTTAHVRPQLTGPMMDVENISYAIRRFVDGDTDIELWGYYCAFDWVAMCGIFGSLAEVPFEFPQMCLDVKQWAAALGDPDLPPQPQGRHHALEDARWTRAAWERLAGV